MAGNELTRRDSSPAVVSDEAAIAVLKSSLYPGARDESVRMVLAYCRAAGLDPIQKPVHIVPMYVKNAGGQGGEMRDVVMPGIGLYRVQAARTGQHAGTSAPEFGPDRTYKLGGKEFTVPEWCSITVYRRMASGETVAFEAREYWIENYATAKRDTDEPNAMWARRPRGQLCKCTESQSLRRAFPEVGSAPTAEEMEGRADASVPSTGHVVEMASADSALIRAGEEAAKRGARALTTWFENLSIQDRKTLSLGERKRLQTIAIDHEPPVAEQREPGADDEMQS